MRGSAAVFARFSSVRITWYGIGQIDLAMKRGTLDCPHRIEQSG